MSQQPMEQQDATGIPGEEDHFAEGLAEALKDDEQPEEIGRASCRERVYVLV